MFCKAYVHNKPFSACSGFLNKIISVINRDPQEMKLTAVSVLSEMYVYQRCILHV